MIDGGTLQIVIVGNGVEAASVAAALAAGLPKSRFSIACLPVATRSDDDEPVTATTPAVRNFHARLNIDDSAIARDCSGSFTLGVAYSGWSSSRPTYFLPYGDIGATFHGVSFHHLAARLRESGEAVQAGDFSLAVMLAQSGRFALPSNDARSILSSFGYGLHLPGAAYAALLLDVAQTNGVVLHAPGEPVELRRDHGNVEAALLSDGREIAGDLFIDATGPMALLGSAMSDTNTGTEDWTDTFGCDRILRVRCRTTSPPSPYSLVAAHACGWRTTVPADGELGEAFAYDSQSLSDEEAEAALLGELHGAPASPVSSAALISRRARLPWRGNCIAIGSAAGTPEPGQSSLELLHASIERLLQLIPVTIPAAIEAREYNRLTTQELDRARDMSAARFVLNGRDGEPFWDRVRAEPRSEELERKVTEFARRGRVPLADGDRRDEPEWAQLLDQLGVRQQRHDVLADAIPMHALRDFFARMRRALIEGAAGVPFHGDFLDGLRRKPAA